MVFGITRCFNESDVIVGSMLRLLAQVDHVVVGEGGSSDGTRELLEALVRDGHPITLLDDEKMNFEQCDVMTAYAHMAREMGATWAAFTDSDEAWYADGGRIADVLMELPRHILIAPARNLTHCVTSEDDPSELDPMTRMEWRSVQMLPLMKVACRLRPDLSIGHGNHSAHFGDVPRPAAVNDLLEVRHFPYRSPCQLQKRVRGINGQPGAYQKLIQADLPRSHGLHMREMGEHWEEFGDEGLERWFQNGMFFEDPASNGDLVHDPLPPLWFPGEAEDASTESVLGST